MEVRAQLDRLRSFLGTDRSILLLCIGLAFLIWLFTKLSQSFITEREVTIDYVVPEKRIMADNSPNLISVRVEATGWEHIRNSLRRKPLNIKLDLDENKDFQSFSNLKIESIIARNLNSNTKISTTSVPSIEVRMDDKAFKRIPVSLLESIKPAPQYKLTDTPIVVPDSVTVSGPRFIIEEFKSVETVRLEMSNLKEPVVVPVKLKSHPLPTLSFEPAEVNCKINVEFYSEKTVEVPIVVQNIPDSIMYVINPRKVKVSFTAVRSIYDKITDQDFAATINFATFDFDNAQPLPIELRVPKGIDKIKMSQEAAELFVNK